MRYKRLKVEGASYFYTVVTHERRKIFTDPDAVILFNAAIAHIQARHPFELEAQVVLPDHIHALWQLPNNDADYSIRWRRIKETFTKSYVKVYKAADANLSRRRRGEQAIWQRRFWEHLIRDNVDFGNHLDYIHLNPVQHGLVSSPSDWPHSTIHEWTARGVYESNWGSSAKPEIPDWATAFE
jgi:putative transposase